MSTYTAVIKHNDPWWVGWIEEITGVNAQAATRQDLLDNLRSALAEAIEMNRADARAAAMNDYEEETVTL